VPDVLRRLAQIVTRRVKRVVVAIAAGKDNNAKFHDFLRGEGNLKFNKPRYGFAAGSACPIGKWRNLRYRGNPPASEHTGTIDNVISPKGGKK
jgi:hypothetical protein